MGKFQMPTVQEFLAKKRLYSKKKDLEWVYLEDEMLKNINIKPYNQKVHEWLLYLKELRHYYHAQRVKEKKKLIEQVGPSWYCELSSQQREVLDNLKTVLHQDLLEDIPRRMRQALHDLGLIKLATKIPKSVLMKTMADSMEDPGVFIWKLYTAIFNSPPNELRAHYNICARVLMSSLVCIDYKDCVAALEKLTYFKKTPSIKKEPKVQKYFEPKVKYGAYLQKMYVPLPKEKEPKKNQALPLGNKLRLRSVDSYEALIKDDSFLQKRILRNRQEREQERICTYKFWEPPGGFRSGGDAKNANIALKMKMLRNKAKPKYKSPFKNVQFQNAGVSYTGGKPNYILGNVNLIPMGYILINAGIVVFRGEPVTTISGFWTYPKKIIDVCDATCDCLAKWEERMIKYVKESKCRCGHLYDLRNEGKPTEKFFYPPNKHGPFWIDKAKVFQMDPMEDFIKDTFKEGLKSNESALVASTPSVSASVCKDSELLAAFLADISNTFLIIPHLPQGNLLNSLQEWVRNRVKGALTPKEERRLFLDSQRQWANLSHIDFRARAYSIPFTEKELKHMNWSHRNMTQKLDAIIEMAGYLHNNEIAHLLEDEDQESDSEITRDAATAACDQEMISFYILLDNFVTRNRVKQVEQSRLWWPTTKYDCYPGKSFLLVYFHLLRNRWNCAQDDILFRSRDIFFTYLPARMQDVNFVEPYSSKLTPKYGAKTCPLDI